MVDAVFKSKNLIIYFYKSRELSKSTAVNNTEVFKQVPPTSNM